jgi:hypothetical protein
MVLTYKRKILAVSFLLTIIACLIVVANNDHKLSPVDQDPDQWWLGAESVRGFQSPVYAKYYKVLLESIDEIEGTVHLRADFQMPVPRTQLLIYIHESLKPTLDQISKNPNPAEVLFGDFHIYEGEAEFALGPSEYPGFRLRPLPHRRPPNGVSESVPTSTQADIVLSGDSWLYPFDKYFIAAQVRCPVLATPDRKIYFEILGDGYTLSSKLPNFIVRNATVNDLEFWSQILRSQILTDESAKKLAQPYRADRWRDGAILLVLERPLFPRFFAVFFGVVALAWVAVVVMIADLKQLSINVFGYFVAIWAIRAPLAVGAPKAPTLMDYVTLGLYALLVAVVLAKFIWGFPKR